MLKFILLGYMPLNYTFSPLGTLYPICALVTSLSHSFILKQEEQPQCIAYQTSFKHFLQECRDLSLIRRYFFKAHNMKDLFENIDRDDILSFLREIKLLQRLLV